MFFNEIQTIQTLYDGQVLVEGSKLKQWYLRVEKEPELVKLKQSFDRTLQQFKGSPQ